MWAVINQIRDCITVDTIHYIAMYIPNSFNFNSVFFGLQSIELFSNSPVINMSLVTSNMGNSNPSADLAILHELHIFSLQFSNTIFYCLRQRVIPTSCKALDTAFLRLLDFRLKALLLGLS